MPSPRPSQRADSGTAVAGRLVAGRGPGLDLLGRQRLAGSGRLPGSGGRWPGPRLRSPGSPIRRRRKARRPDGRAYGRPPRRSRGRPRRSFAVGDDPGADPGPDGQQDQVRRSSSRAVAPFAVGGQVGVVVDPHGDAQEPLQGRLDVDVVQPAGVRRLQDAAGFEVEDPGQAEAGGRDRLRPPVPSSPAHSRFDQGEETRRPRRCGSLGLEEKLAVLVDQPGT